MGLGWTGSTCCHYMRLGTQVEVQELIPMGLGGAGLVHCCHLWLKT